MKFAVEERELTWKVSKPHKKENREIGVMGIDKLCKKVNKFT